MFSRFLGGSKQLKPPYKQGGEAQNAKFVFTGLTQKRSPNRVKKGAMNVPPFLRGARGDQGFRLQVRKS